MILAYVLTMPNVGSCNGKWGGEANLYARTKNYNSKSSKILAEKILSEAPYSYAWSDGWRASISVRVIDGKEKRKIDRKTKGFCGYDWMIDSIIRDQTIQTTIDRRKEE